MQLATLNATSALLGAAATALCAFAGWRRRRTTLAAPCAWAAASLFVLTADVTRRCLAASDSQPPAAAHFDYLAGITAVAPFVALLGAKRPQNVAWQWIVVSLVGLLAFQDLRSWSIDAAPPSPHVAWRWLLAGIIIMQLLNYLATRYAAAAGLAAIGQIGVLAGYLPFLPARTASLLPAGLALVSSAALLAWLLSRRRRREADVWQAAWFEFRDDYGALWGLRVAERVNAISGGRRAAVRLTWHGFEHAGAIDASPIEATQALHRAFRSVLMRFTSTAWLVQPGDTVGIAETPADIRQEHCGAGVPPARR